MILEASIEDNFSKSLEFSREISIVSAVHSSFTHDLEKYDFMKLYCGSMELNLRFWSLIDLNCTYSDDS